MKDDTFDIRAQQQAPQPAEKDFENALRPLSFDDFSGQKKVVENLRKNMNAKLAAMEEILATRDWIAGDFSAADILLADVLRVPEAEGALADYPALTAYVARATARPAFQRALADHMAHWATADAARATQPEGEAR